MLEFTKFERVKQLRGYSFNKQDVQIKQNRLWINSLEVEDIKKGFQNLKPGSDYERMFAEVQVHQISDWIIGMNASKLYTLT